MPRAAKNIAGFFVFLALIALGGDIYIWQHSDGHPFAFAALGYLSKTYLAEYHQLVVDAFTPETFNVIFTPILAIPAVFFCLGMAAVTLVLGFITHVVKSGSKGQMAPKNKNFEYKRK